MNNKGRAGKRSTKARVGKLGEFWSMLEHFWSVWSWKMKNQVVRPKECTLV
jgi:hypothetical protein